MKFAKELEEQAVPEWRTKYLDYKQGKKKLKAVSRAVRIVHTSSSAHDDRSVAGRPRSSFASLRDGPVISYLQRGRPQVAQQAPKSSLSTSAPLQSRSRSEHGTRTSPRLSQLGDNAADETPRARAINEASPLFISGQSGKQSSRPERWGMTRYGSIIATPPDNGGKDGMEKLRLAPSLELPEPAWEAQDAGGRPQDIGEEAELSASLRSSKDNRGDGRGVEEVLGSEDLPQPPSTQLGHRGNAYEVTKPTDTAPAGSAAKAGGKRPEPRHRSVFKRLQQPQGRKSLFSTAPGGRPFTLRRMFSVAAAGSPGSARRSSRQAAADVALEAYREVDFRQAEFFFFLDRELQKIEGFYKEKEDAATDRLEVLREQLHIMRDRRLGEVLAAQAKRERAATSHRQRHVGAATDGNETDTSSNGQLPNGITSANDEAEAMNHAYRRAHPFKASIDMTKDALDRYRTGHVGKTSRAMGDLGTPRGLTAQQRLREQQDYMRRHGANSGPPYRTAKRKLKIALAEYYRGLEMLKGYALLNRTAFRKITKKFDKSGIGDGAEGKEYMASQIETAHFVQSPVLDDLLDKLEDLYARYFERGNHKLAVSKLRAKASRPGSYYAAVLRTGLLLAAGFVLGLQGVVYGTLQLYPSAPPTPPWEGREMQASYLLQIYGGYFLMLALVLLFALDAAVFTHYRVNYAFIFEFSPRHTLHYLQLAELPAWFGFALGLTLYLNFALVAGGEAMYVYWPVVLVGVSILGLCVIPPPWFYPRSRGWLLATHWRLFWSGAYPVEFRDFFLGDMYCSQTYALGNIELFFCAYARHWTGMAQCNSSHSRLLGFFQTVPGIWRLFQCLRRYHDSGLWTHLANGLKYTATISQYASLSLWRVAKPNHSLEALFIACATLNSCYCIFWDLFYDWSLPMSLSHKPPLLRDQLAYRRHIWWYYVAIFLDPVLRFNWIFYVIYAHDAQHSSLISFLISLSEVLRRGMWVLFRVENEHSTNVGRYRAQRDPALPYEVSVMSRQSSQTQLLQAISATQVDGQQTTHAPDTETIAAASGRDPRQVPGDVEQGPAPPPSGSLRQRWLTRSPSKDTSPVYAAIRRAGNVMLAAHALDYERKKPEAERQGDRDKRDTDDEDDDDDDEEDDDDGR